MKLKSTLTLNDLLVLVMAKFMNGANGEGMIHEAVYEFVNMPEFKSLEQTAGFIDIGGRIFSPQLHNIIKKNTDDVSNKKDESPNPFVGFMFSDKLRFDAYDKVAEEEAPYYVVMNDMEPRIYWLSPTGQAIGQILFRKKLTNNQRKVLAAFYKSNISKSEEF